ncbi:MAG: hypothetical protein ABW204_03405 [Microbacteriaceae bacterium]
MRRAPAAGACLLALVLSGCAAPSALVAAPEGVTATASQSRLDLGTGRLVITVVNASDDELVIERAELLSTLWVEPLEQSPPGAVAIGAGRTVDVRVAPGELDCAADAPGEHSARLTTAHGAFEIDAPDVYEQLAALHEQGCLAERVGELRIVDLRDDELVLQVPDGAVVEGVRATTLLTPTGSPSASGDEVTVRMRPSRCDAHALAEDKAGTRIPVAVRLEDGTAGELVVAADDALRASIQQWVRETCGTASGAP